MKVSTGIKVVDTLEGANPLLRLLHYIPILNRGSTVYKCSSIESLYADAQLAHGRIYELQGKINAISFYSRVHSWGFSSRTKEYCKITIDDESGSLEVLTEDNFFIPYTGGGFGPNTDKPNKAWGRIQRSEKGDQVSVLGVLSEEEYPQFYIWDEFFRNFSLEERSPHRKLTKSS